MGKRTKYCDCCGYTELERIYRRSKNKYDRMGIWYCPKCMRLYADGYHKKEIIRLDQWAFANLDRPDKPSEKARSLDPNNIYIEDTDS